MDGKIKILRRTKGEWLVTIIIAIVFLWGTMLDLLKLPSLVKYIADVMWVGLVLVLLANRNNRILRRNGALITLVFLLWITTVIGYFANIYSPLYYLWGLRNNFRFFIFFFSCFTFLREKTGQSLLMWFEKLILVNFLVACVQFFVLGYKQDYVGGIFGVSAGCNGKLIVFLGIVTAWGAIMYLNEKKKITVFIVECLMNLIVAAMAELKFYYILFVFLIMIASLITNFTYKKLLVILVCSVGFIMGTSLLVDLFPKWEGIFNVESLIQEVSSTKGYTGNGGLNRLTTIPIISSLFLKTTSARLFGLGLGHCDTSAFSFLNTPFFRQYGHLHYNFFSSAFAFLETGMIGLVIYCAFFVAVYIQAKKREDKKQCRKEWGQMARIAAILGLILIIYNSSMRSEEAYLLYFVLSLPFIERRSEKCPILVG